MTTGVPTADELHLAAGGRLRPGAPPDAIDGVIPQWVVEPANAESVAAVLQWCTNRREPVVIRGGGTHLEWGRPPAAVGVVLSLRALDRILRYEPGDLTVTVEAGCPISKLNRELAAHGQWLPFDVFNDAETIGGAIATNDCGPLRHRYGTPRDLLIGTRLATADGRLASSGGQVVKNVAGYDLGRMVTGSFGAYAAVVSATFKLAPVPAATVTLAAEFTDARSLASAAEAISASQLDPMVVEADATFAADHRYQLLVRFGGTPAANAEQADAAYQLVSRSAPRASALVSADDERELWWAWMRRHRSPAGLTLRASWMPARLADALALVERVHHDASIPMAFTGRATVGSGTIQADGDPGALAAVVEQLRHAEALGHVVLMRAPAAVKARADVWGAPGSAAVITRALKHALDPSGVLNAGRGPV